MKQPGCIAVAWLLTTLSGCAVAPPFKAVWYRVEDRGVHVAVLNQGSKQCKLQSLVLNRTDDRRNPGWVRKKERELLPGALIVAELADFKLENDAVSDFPICMVPVEISLVPVPGDCQYWAWRGEFRIHVTAGLPNAVPVELERCLDARKAQAPP